jgi:uncharacterized lipoprotein YddW (UPF0748 family)
MKKSFFFSFLLLLVSTAFTQKNTEFRATWLVTWDLVNSNNSVDANKALCRRILDNHEKANMNAVLWHARQSGTAYYDSDIEPWGHYAGGSNPGYDIFEYAVQQAHNRNMEIHAWINVFHCSSTQPGTPAAEHPEWVCTNEDGIFMTKYRCLSPGLPEVREYLTRITMEVVRKYDVDGIHFDFVRWNEYDEDDMQPGLAKIAENKILDGQVSEDRINRLNTLGTKRFIYDSQHPANGGIPDGFNSWENWRRWSVTEFVKMAHDSIQAVKPWVRLSVAALGKYNWTSWQGYGTVFQDAALWFNEGYIDQLTPMHYHWLQPESFYNMLAGPDGNSDIDQCWGKYIQKGINEGRLFTCGPASYLLHENNIWENHVSIVNKAREVPWVDGFQFFSYSSWRDRNYWNAAKANIFTNKTKIRATGLTDATTPDSPTIVLTKLDTTVYRVSVYPSETGEEPFWMIVYRSKDSTSLSDAKIVRLEFTDRSFHHTDYINEREGGYYYYGATALDRHWNESLSSNITKTDSIPEKSIVPNPVTLLYVKKTETGYLISWQLSKIEDNKGYRIFGKSGAHDWLLLADESTLTEGTSEAEISVPAGDEGWLFTVRAVGLGPMDYESTDPDIYGGNMWTDLRVLVIDAFDRITGSWRKTTHPFAQRVCSSLNRLKISYDCSSNESFETGALEATDYDAIFWLSGDEAQTDESVSFKEVSLLANYLRKGGNLLVSGSEVGYDLDFLGSSQEKRFFNEYLKSKYISNGSNGNGYQVNGENRRIYSGLNFNFDDGSYGFNVLTPDIYETNGGSLPCLRYQNGSSIAGTQYVGTIGSGSENAKVICLGFPFETIYNETEIDTFLYRSLSFFDFFGTSAINENKSESKEYKLSYNYPNPFNGSTSIIYEVQGIAASFVILNIYDVRGREVKTLINKVQHNGLHKVFWNGKDDTGNAVTSGIYFYKLQISDQKQTRKILLIQ